MANEPKVNLAFVETLPNNPVKGTVYMSPDSAEGFLKVGVGDNETETIFDSSVYAKKSDSVWVRGDGANSAVLKDTSSYAAGTGAVAHGDNVYASGDYSHAEGKDSSASGNYSHAEGESTRASGDYSHAEGFDTTASGSYSHAEGHDTIASGISSHASGACSRASGEYADANNRKTSALGSYSHAEGSYSVASGRSSHAEGFGTNSFGEYSHAEGGFTFASGLSSHAEGGSNTSSIDRVNFYKSGDISVGTYSVSYRSGATVTDITTRIYPGYTIVYQSAVYGGGKLEAQIKYSTAKVLDVSKYSLTLDRVLTPDSSSFSASTIYYVPYDIENVGAYGVASHVEGIGTVALNDVEHAQGQFNISHDDTSVFGDANNTVHTIGIGISDSSRANAVEVMQNGDVYIMGIGSYDGSNYIDASTLQQVVGNSGGSMISITYADLKNLRDTSALIPGMQYRITDYHCSTTQQGTSTADNQFDIIVTADSSTVLNENATAAKHTDSSIDYFAKCNLKAWELKYSLDNDANYFAWADTSNGKGVIYYMKDEWNNECPYDFKNIKFQRWAVTADQEHPRLVVDNEDNYYGYYYGAKDVDGNNILVDATYGEDNGYFYTFALKDLESGEWFDYTVVAHLGLKNDEGNETACYNNHLAEATHIYTSGNGEIAKMLNDIVFFNCYTDLSDTSNANDYSYCNSNSFLSNCLYNTFGNNSGGNIFGNMCMGNTFGNNSGGNSFGYNCSGNIFGNNCNGNIFGNMCQYNTFTGFCLCNTFGNGCTYNSFKDECNNNSFGNDCGWNIFGNNCNGNSFGNSYNGNTFRNDCNNNSFGNSCSNNSFGDYCSENSFGDNCSENLFGDYFQYNSFGNYCFQNLFTSYFQAITVFDGVQNCSVTGGTQQAAPVKNAQILNGTAGASRQNRLTIAFTANQNYTQIAGLNSSGVLKIWTPADLIN